MLLTCYTSKIYQNLLPLIWILFSGSCRPSNYLYISIHMQKKIGGHFEVEIICLNHSPWNYFEDPDSPCCYLGFRKLFSPYLSWNSVPSQHNLLKIRLIIPTCRLPQEVLPWHESAEKNRWIVSCNSTRLVMLQLYTSRAWASRVTEVLTSVLWSAPCTFLNFVTQRCLPTR